MCNLTSDGEVDNNNNTDDIITPLLVTCAHNQYGCIMVCSSYFTP